MVDSQHDQLGSVFPKPKVLYWPFTSLLCQKDSCEQNYLCENVGCREISMTLNLMDPRLLMTVATVVIVTAAVIAVLYM